MESLRAADTVDAMDSRRLPSILTRFPGIVALAAAALLPLACGGGDDGSDARPESTPQRETTTVAEDPEPEAPARDVEEMALALDDLPTGWAASPSDEDGDDGDDPSDMAEDCDIDDDVLPEEFEPSEEVEREFQKSQMGPFVFHSVGRLEAAEAEQAMGAFRTMVEQCTDYTSTDDDGNQVRGSFAPVSYPSHGDETFAARLSMEGEGFLAEGDLVAVREGGDVVLVFGIQMTTFMGGQEFAEGEFETIVDTAVAKAFA